MSDGQKVFLESGLMEYGSIFGHGAYLGPDFTADYLHRSSESVRDQLGGERSTRRARRRSTSSSRTTTTSGRRPCRSPRSRRTRSASSRPTTPGSSRGHHLLRPPPGADRRPRGDPGNRVLRLVGLAASARRPGNYSHEQLAPEDQVGNEPSANVIVWSVISLIALLGGIGILFARVRRWRWDGRTRPGDADVPVPR